MSSSTNAKLEEELNLFLGFTVYFGYGVVFAIACLHQCFDILTCRTKHPPKGYAPIAKGFEVFYRQRLYHRIRDCFSRPIASNAGARMKVLEREVGTLKYTGKVIECVNFASYNYLGFCELDGPCKPDVMAVLNKYGVSTCSPQNCGGATKIHAHLERSVADFLGVEDAMIFGMGWATNTSAIPALVGRGCLVVSDTINHNSIIMGSRSSGAKITTFPHGDLDRLEQIIRRSIVDGQPRTHRPWRKILIIVEGVYSMEGDISDLRRLVDIKKKYKCYLYMDEAHSIGAVGATGRGVTEYRGVNPKDVDILMGTFTKSFGAIGGYVAGTKELVGAIRGICASHVYSSGLSPPCVAQVDAACRLIQTTDGIRRIKQLHENVNYLRSELDKAGLHTIGDFDSGLVPVIIGDVAKGVAFSRECLKRRVAVVIVGFPATSILTGRARFCVSAGSTQEDIERAVVAVKEVAVEVHMCYKTKFFG